MKKIFPFYLVKLKPWPVVISLNFINLIIRITLWNNVKRNIFIVFTIYIIINIFFFYMYVYIYIYKYINIKYNKNICFILIHKIIPVIKFIKLNMIL